MPRSVLRRALEPKPKLCAGLPGYARRARGRVERIVPAALKHEHGRRAADVIQALRAPLAGPSDSP
ncbi:MAG: hypothetical protein U0235_31070 [Polyangiaceae bacterium]